MFLWFWETGIVTNLLNDKYFNARKNFNIVKQDLCISSPVINQMEVSVKQLSG